MRIKGVQETSDSYTRHVLNMGKHSQFLTQEFDPEMATLLVKVSIYLLHRNHHVIHLMVI